MAGKSGEMKIDFSARLYTSQLIKRFNTVNAAFNNGKSKPPIGLED
jgi:hypothetical protein